MSLGWILTVSMSSDRSVSMYAYGTPDVDNAHDADAAASLVAPGFGSNKLVSRHARWLCVSSSSTHPELPSLPCCLPPRLYAANLCRL